MKAAMLAAQRAVPLAPALAAGLLLGGCGAGGVSRSDYVARNETILKALPVFPGAVKAREYSVPEYSGGEFADPSGYTTTLVSRVPRGTRRAAVARFYRSRLHRRGWQVILEAGTARSVRRAIVDYTRDGALVAVNTLLLTQAREPYAHRLYEVAVDHRGAPGD